MTTPKTHCEHGWGGNLAACVTCTPGIRIRPICDWCAEGRAYWVIETEDGRFFACKKCKESMVRPLDAEDMCKEAS